MSHELKTPCSGILGLTNRMLERNKISGPVRQQLQLVNDCAETLFEIIGGMLDMSKIEAGTVRLLLAHSGECVPLRTVVRALV